MTNDMTVSSAFIIIRSCLEIEPKTPQSWHFTTVLPSRPGERELHHLHNVDPSSIIYSYNSTQFSRKGQNCVLHYNRDVQEKMLENIFKFSSLERISYPIQSRQAQISKNCTCNIPLARGDKYKQLTSLAPELLPNIVTESGSPPNLLISCRTQRKAATMSLRAAFP